jgi:hypothetical protein
VSLFVGCRSTSHFYRKQVLHVIEQFQFGFENRDCHLTVQHGNVWDRINIDVCAAEEDADSIARRMDLMGVFKNKCYFQYLNRR